MSDMAPHIHVTGVVPPVGYPPHPPAHLQHIISGLRHPLQQQAHASEASECRYRTFGP